MRRCYLFTTSCAVRVVRTGAGLLALSLLASGASPALRQAMSPIAAHAETREETAQRERLDAERADQFRARQWDDFLIALKAKDNATALKPWVRLPITVGDKSINTVQDFTAIVRSPRVLRGINRSKIITTSTGFTVEWKGEGAAKYNRYMLTFNQSENDEDRYLVTNWSKWTQNY